MCNLCGKRNRLPVKRRVSKKMKKVFSRQLVIAVIRFGTPKRALILTMLSDGNRSRLRRTLEHRLREPWPNRHQGEALRNELHRL
jgi:hypothetical protein